MKLYIFGLFSEKRLTANFSVNVYTYMMTSHGTLFLFVCFAVLCFALGLDWFGFCFVLCYVLFYL